MDDAETLRDRLQACPPGRDGWKEFEDVGIDIRRFLFVPPLTEPIIQPRSYSGVDRRDAVFPNRNLKTANNWSHIYHELNARMILVEFKNYDVQEIGEGRSKSDQKLPYTTHGKTRIDVL
jgi:hypothetical protein